MEKAIENKIKLKIAISLKILLDRSKNSSKSFLADSYNTIALNADIRKATVSNIFNAKSNPNSTTLISIIEAMGFSLTDFSEIYCAINEKDISQFNKNEPPS